MAQVSGALLRSDHRAWASRVQLRNSIQVAQARLFEAEQLSVLSPFIWKRRLQMRIINVPTQHGKYAKLPDSAHSALSTLSSSIQSQTCDGAPQNTYLTTTKTSIQY